MSTDPFVAYDVDATPQDTFVVPFQFWADSDLTVQVDDVGAAFTTTGVGEPTGGTVILTGGAVTNVRVTIQRLVPEERLSTFPIAGPFRIEVLNQELDHIIAMVADRRFVGENDQVIWDDIVGKPDVVVWDELYPVGSVHLTFINQAPPRGTWELIEAGRFLTAAGSGYPVDSTGGLSEVVLNTSQMPIHSHGHNFAVGPSGSHSHTSSSGSPFIINRASNIHLTVLFNGNNPQYTDESVTSTAPDHIHALTGGIQDAGGGVPHENRPPYIAVYMWRRTA